jgi:hypothetical protein
MKRTPGQLGLASGHRPKRIYDWPQDRYFSKLIDFIGEEDTKWYVEQLGIK